MQIFVLLVHATVEPALANIKRLHLLPLALSSRTFPYLLKRLRVDIADAETTIHQMR